MIVDLEGTVGRNNEVYSAFRGLHTRRNRLRYCPLQPAAANACAARISSCVNRGWSSRIASDEMPARSLLKTNSTEMRVPRMTGLPSMISGLTLMRPSRMVLSMLDSKITNSVEPVILG